MTKNLKKQIKVYAGVAGAILSADKLNAQVVYHDIFPDDTVPTSTQYLQYDLDGNGNIDINIIQTGYNMGSMSTDPHGFIIYIYGNYIQKINSIGCLNNVNMGDAALLNQSDTIPGNVAGVNFANEARFEDGFETFWSSNINGCFHAAGQLNADKCIGIKFNIGGQMHYAWMRIELLNHAVVIKDYAYQLQPNVPILACDTANLAIGISEYNNHHFYFSQQGNSIHISSFQKFSDANISVYDLLGKEILQQSFEGNETIINIDKKGIYFVEVKSEKGISRKKVFIY